MNKTDKAQILEAIELLHKRIEKIDPDLEPSSCSFCLHHNISDGICDLHDPPMPIPKEDYPVGCSKWKWDGMPF